MGCMIQHGIVMIRKSIHFIYHDQFKRSLETDQLVRGGKRKCAAFEPIFTSAVQYDLPDIRKCRCQTRGELQYNILAGVATATRPPVASTYASNGNIYFRFARARDSPKQKFPRRNRGRTPVTCQLVPESKRPSEPATFCSHSGVLAQEVQCGKRGFLLRGAEPPLG